MAATAREFGMAMIAASTHPFANWRAQKKVEKERYLGLARDMQALASRLVVCGMHVHAGIEDDELRIDLMNQATYFLPHLLALSSSSPFWEGQPTGLRVPPDSVRRSAAQWPAGALRQRRRMAPHAASVGADGPV